MAPPLPPREVGKVSLVANLSVSGMIGAATIDTDVRLISITQTTAGLTLTLPNPGDTSVLAGLDVLNAGSAAFTMYGRSIPPGTMVRCAWSGSALEADSAPTAVATPPSYTVAALPAGTAVGQIAYATNGAPSSSRHRRGSARSPTP